MKSNLLQFIACSLLLIAMSSELSAQFIFTGVGDYTNTARWSPSYPGPVYPIEPVIIDGACTVTINLSFDQALTINSGATLIQAVGSGQIATGSSPIFVEGNVVLTDVTNIFKVTGTGQLTINGDISGVGRLASDESTILGTGSFSPGNPASAQGVLVIAGKFDMRNKTFNAQLFGNQDNDVLNLQGVDNTFLDGTLNVTLEGGYVPSIGHSFTIINSAAVIDNIVSGNTAGFAGKSFATLNLPALPADRMWEIDYSGDGVVLSVTAALPVELLSFTGENNGKANVLNWTTVTEMDNAHFEIERSITGQHFEKIGLVKGAGTSYETQKYQFVDENYKNSVNYYRLKQVDTDGTFTYSDVIAIKNTKGIVRQLYPNPVRSELFVEATLESFEYKITTLTGQVFQTGIASPQQAISTETLPQGVYLLQLEQKTVQFVKD